MTTARRPQRTIRAIDNAILDCVAVPRSPREIFAETGNTLRAHERFNALISSGKIARYGTRKTFDFGCEVLYLATPKSAIYAP